MRSITDRLTTTVRALVLANVGVYLFYVFARSARPFMEMHLALGPRLFAGELWQPVTSLFVHLDFIGFLFSMIGLWYVGMGIELGRGPGRATALFFGSGVLANLAVAGAWLLRGFGPVPFADGCSFAVMAMCVAFARIYGRQPIQFWPTTLMVQARYLILMMVGLSVLIIVAQANWPALAGLAVAIVVGFFGAGPGGMSEIRTFFAQARDISRARRLRRRFGVIEGGGRRPPKKYVN
jgi:membrane associated rhomboid family serine protease